MTPRQFREGVTTDISPWLQFTFYQCILYLDNENSWPSTKERSGRWMGVSENIGDFLTFWVLDDQSKQLLARSVVRPNNNNLRVKWDPSLAQQPGRETAQHGGDIMPPAEERKEKLSNLEDKYDKQEPEPEGRFYEANETWEYTDSTFPKNPYTFPKDLDLGKEQEPPILDSSLSPHPRIPMTPLILDTSLSICVPIIPDAYNGSQRLRFSRDTLPKTPKPQNPKTPLLRKYNDNLHIIYTKIFY
jgi:hypothetical protein